MAPGIFLGSMPRCDADILRLTELRVVGVLSVHEPWETVVPPKRLLELGIKRQLLLSVPDFGAPSPADIDEGLVFVDEVRTPASGATDVDDTQQRDPQNTDGTGRSSLAAPVDAPAVSALTPPTAAPSGARRPGVYVHCRYGKGRSVVLVLCYLMREAAIAEATTGVPWSLDGAYDGLMALRPQMFDSRRWGRVSPQWRSLTEYETKLRAWSSTHRSDAVATPSSGPPDL